VPQVNKFHSLTPQLFGINISFGVISWGTSVSLTLNNFVNIRGFTFATSDHIVIIA
jgi:hypothetical protein